MALVSIGPVTISHGDPSFSDDAAPTNHGIRSGSIGGSCSWSASDALLELVDNPDAQTTIGGVTGVLEYLVFDDDLLVAKTGYYLLERFSRNATQRDSLTTTDVPFTLQAAYLGDVA